MVIVVDEEESSDDSRSFCEEFNRRFPGSIDYFVNTGPKSYAASLVFGLRKAVEFGSDCIIQMDADGSHSPSQILKISESSGDVVIGSRYHIGAKIRQVPVRRVIYSILGNVYLSFTWRTLLRDKTNGFRAFKPSTYEILKNLEVSTSGFAVQLEVLKRFLDSEMTVTEVPIDFVYRRLGDSKFDLSKLREAFQEANRSICQRKRSK